MRKLLASLVLGAICIALIGEVHTQTPQTPPNVMVPAAPTYPAPNASQESNDGSLKKAPSSTKETKETKETTTVTNIKEHPDPSVGITNALAWPITALLLAIILVSNKDLSGIVKPVLSKVKFGGIELEFNMEALRARAKETKESFNDLTAKADQEYELIASKLELSKHLEAVVRRSLPAVLKSFNLQPPTTIASNGPC